MSHGKRFGANNLQNIKNEIENLVPTNTKKSKSSVWKQFNKFCLEKNYKLQQDTTMENLALILVDWGYNMRKTDGNDYKERVVKHMWNTVAKLIQEKYFSEYNINVNPFNDMVFKGARDARDAKRKLLQIQPEKRKVSSAPIAFQEYEEILSTFDEDCPYGLQKKFFHVVSYELAWRGGEAVKCLVQYFKIELNNAGIETGRIEYNPIFEKTAQGGAQRLADSKWLIHNSVNPERCPVRYKFLFK